MNCTYAQDSLPYKQPGRVAQSVGRLTHKSGSWVRYPVWQHTFVSPSAFSRRAVVSYWRKYVHEVLVNRLGCLSLPRKSVIRLTDRPDMTLDVYRGLKQQYNNNNRTSIYILVKALVVLKFYKVKLLRLFELCMP